MFRATIRLWLIVLVAAMALPARVAQAVVGVSDLFRDYYAEHDGVRVLGYPLTDLLDINGYPSQYFEKGRIEDHHREIDEPAWLVMYGRLTAELMERTPASPVNATSLTYAGLLEQHDPRYRHAPPAGFTSGVMETDEGTFVPYDAQLRRANGYIVPFRFWSYINRAGLFPGGWLHDIGLPLTDAVQVTTVKAGKTRTITMQAFERTVLTDDPLNPAAWQIERGNLGRDMIQAQAPASPIVVPATGALATLPLHVLARVGAPGEALKVALRWQDGTTLSAEMTALRGEDGHGLLIGSINWLMEGGPPATPSQWAMLEISNRSGVVLARQGVYMLGMDDPDTTTIKLYWVLGEEVVSIQRQIPQTVRVGAAALEELLWGPTPPNLAGFETAIPTPAQVLSYPGREADWGPRVYLLSLKIVNGVATADFSQELRAYGGGSLRVRLINQQIARTLQQFPSVREVRIAIEGQIEGELQP